MNFPKVPKVSSEVALISFILDLFFFSGLGMIIASSYENPINFYYQKMGVWFIIIGILSILIMCIPVVNMVLLVPFLVVRLGLFIGSTIFGIYLMQESIPSNVQTSNNFQNQNQYQHENENILEGERENVPLLKEEEVKYQNVHINDKN
jgi:hypothetical protein